MATTRPRKTPLPRRTLPRPYPRQEPSALAAHAGICAGGRPQGRSLPRSSRRGWGWAGARCIAGLSGEQARRLYTLITGWDPWQLEFEFALWTRELVRVLTRWI
jgi:hypothetical protein